MKSLTLVTAALIAVLPLRAQDGGGDNTPQRQAQALDRDGKGAEARVIWQRLIDSAVAPKAKSDMQRRMAMSYGFEHD